MRQIASKICPIALLLVIFISALSVSIMHVSAGGSFADNSSGWANIQNSIYASPTNTYPYSNLQSNATNTNFRVSKVGLDILYGTTKGFGLAQYHGEVPYKQVYDSNGNKADGFGNKYARPGTSTDSNNFGNTAKDYWGFSDSVGQGAASLGDYESKNDNGVVSLRFYALANTTGGMFGAIGQFFSNLLYVIGLGLALLGTTIISLLVDAKNIDLKLIMDMLKLDELEKVFTSNFIANRDAAGNLIALSPFALFAIIMFIIAIVAYVIRYVKGQDKEIGIKDILLTAGIGVFIIAICLTGKLHMLGSTASDAANKVMTTLANVSSSNNGDAFTTSITDSENTNKITQLSEMSMVNKIFIDMQICAQFGVSDIDDLNVQSLGDTNALIANGTNPSVTSGSLMQYVDTANTTGATFQTEFGNNLGYFYWFANSSAVKKTVGNATFPDTNASAAEDKLEGMITYLQTLYNYNITQGNTTQNEAIRRIILSFATPNGASGFVCMFLLAVILVILAICLFKYGMNVVIGKLELFLSILGLTVAGVFMVTTNKKLVATGKTILGMIPVAFIEITIYSVVFDLILYLVASLMSTNILQLLIVLFLILLLLKLNPVIQEKIKQLIDNSTRAISPALANTKRAIKAYTRQKANDFITNYDRSKKVVGYDANGNEITQERGGNALSKLMHQGYNTVYNDGMQREGFFKINHQQNETRARNVSASAEQKRRDAENVVNDVMTEINDDAQKLANAEQAAEKTYIDDRYTINGDETIYNEDNLSDEEREKVTEIVNTRSEADAIANSSTYKKLMAEKNYIDSENAKHKDEEGYTDKVMDEGRAKKLETLNNQLNEKLKQATELDASLKKSIKEEAKDFAFTKLDFDKNAEGLTDDEKLRNAAKKKSQDNHMAELQKALQDGINTIREETNTRISSKIGSSTATVNQAAMAASAAMMYQKEQLDKGKLVSDTNTAKNATKDIVNMVAQYNDKHTGSNVVDNAKKEVERSAKILDRDGDAKPFTEAVKGLQDARQEVKETKALGKENRKETKENVGSMRPSISDQLENAININSTSTSGLTKAAVTAATVEAQKKMDNTPPTNSVAKPELTKNAESVNKSEVASVENTETIAQPQSRVSRSETFTQAKQNVNSTSQVSTSDQNTKSSSDNSDSRSTQDVQPQNTQSQPKPDVTSTIQQESQDKSKVEAKTSQIPNQTKQQDNGKSKVDNNNQNIPPQNIAPTINQAAQNAAKAEVTDSQISNQNIQQVSQNQNQSKSNNNTSAVYQTVQNKANATANTNQTQDQSKQQNIQSKSQNQSQQSQPQTQPQPKQNTTSTVYQAVQNKDNVEADNIQNQAQSQNQSQSQNYSQRLQSTSPQNKSNNSVNQAQNYTSTSQSNASQKSTIAQTVKSAQSQTTQTPTDKSTPKSSPKNIAEMVQQRTENTSNSSQGSSSNNTDNNESSTRIKLNMKHSADIETVTPVSRSKEDYLKDEGREHFATEQITHNKVKSSSYTDDDVPVDRWANKRKK